MDKIDSWNFFIDGVSEQLTLQHNIYKSLKAPKFINLDRTIVYCYTEKSSSIADGFSAVFVWSNSAKVDFEKQI